METFVQSRPHHAAGPAVSGVLASSHSSLAGIWRWLLGALFILSNWPYTLRIMAHERHADGIELRTSGQRPRPHPEWGWLHAARVPWGPRRPLSSFWAAASSGLAGLCLFISKMRSNQQHPGRIASQAKASSRPNAALFRPIRSSYANVSCDARATPSFGRRAGENFEFALRRIAIPVGECWKSCGRRETRVPRTGQHWPNPRDHFSRTTPKVKREENWLAPFST